MTIRIQCTCGQPIELAGAPPGGPLRCPRCGLAHSVIGPAGAAKARRPAAGADGRNPGWPAIAGSACAVLLLSMASVWAVFAGQGSAPEPHGAAAVAALEPPETPPPSRAPQAPRPRPARPASPRPEPQPAPVRVRPTARSRPATPPRAEPAASPPKTPSAQELFDRASPAVVRIEVSKRDRSESTASGFFVTADGVLVTNHHVVRGAILTTVKVADNTTLRVEKLLATDPRTDLALLKVRGGNFKFLRVADGPPPKVGTKVYAIGFPLGLNVTFSEGLVSSLQKEGPRLKYIQTTAAISPGSSGGPLLVPDGRVVAVTTGAYLDRERLAQNLNLAVPAAKLRSLLRRANVSVAGAAGEP